MQLLTDMQYWHHCSFHFKLKAAQCHSSLQMIQMPSYSWKRYNLQFEEIISNFELADKQLFSFAGWMFKPDRCRLTDKRFEALMFVDYSKDFKHWLFLFNQYLKCLLQWSNWWEGREAKTLSPAKCKNQASTYSIFWFHYSFGFQ